MSVGQEHPHFLEVLLVALDLVRCCELPRSSQIRGVADVLFNQWQHGPGLAVGSPCAASTPCGGPRLSSVDVEGQGAMWPAAIAKEEELKVTTRQPGRRMDTGQLMQELQKALQQTRGNVA